MLGHYMYIYVYVYWNIFNATHINNVNMIVIMASLHRYNAGRFIHRYRLTDMLTTYVFVLLLYMKHLFSQHISKTYNICWEYSILNPIILISPCAYVTH
jgi:hypothetical protein